MLLEDPLPVYPTEVRGTAPKAHLCRHVALILLPRDPIKLGINIHAKYT
jgi:hypothetical protein